jgi:hypothetical protein
MSRFHLSRFQGMNVPHYRVWEPPEASVRVEYSDEVLRETARHERGVLYGTREGATLRVIAARREQPVRDSRISRLELLGTFAYRERGEIFLTEPDIQHLELTGGSIALLVAGTNAGFFVYEPDGAIQTIQSYREFSLLDRPPDAPVKALPDRRKLWISFACLIPLAFSVAHIPRARPIALNVHEDAHQLRITWNPGAFPTARLEIADGPERIWIPVSRNLASATYVPHSSDVRIRLIAGSRSADAHFVGVDIAPEVEHVKQLESEAASLRVELTRGVERTSRLETAIRRTLAQLRQ